MARPRKQRLEYFPLDVDFFLDDKIVILGSEFGPKGEIAAVKLLCAIYRNGYYLEWNDLAKARFLQDIGGPMSAVEAIISRMIKIKFLDKDMFENEGVLTSPGIQRRFFEASKYRVLDAESLPYLLVMPNNYANRHTSEKTDKVAATTSASKALKIPSRRIGQYEARADFLERFFDISNEPIIRKVCAEIGTTSETFHSMAIMVVDEWKLAEKKHRDYSDAASNLINHIRCKVKGSSRQSGRPGAVSPGEEQARERAKRNQRKPEVPTESDPSVTFEEWSKSRGIENMDAAQYAAKVATDEQRAIDSIAGVI